MTTMATGRTAVLRLLLLLALALGVLLPFSAPAAHALSPCYGTDPPPTCTYGTSAQNPTGQLLTAVRVPGAVAVTGWAHDDPALGADTVVITLDGTSVGTVTANLAGGPSGAADAFSATLPIPTLTGSQICATAVNQGLGTGDTAIGCIAVSVQHNPVGALDSLVFNSDGSATGTGWALDPDIAGPIQVVVHWRGTSYPAVAADQPYSGLGASHPGYGDDHGFTVHFVPTPPLTGNWGVAVYGLNVDAGADTLVGGVISS